MIYSVSALEDINDDSELWGGKAVSISKLKKNDFKVPRDWLFQRKHMNYLLIIRLI